MNFEALKTKTRLFERLSTYGTQSAFLKAIRKQAANPLASAIQSTLAAIEQWASTQRTQAEPMAGGELPLLGALPQNKAIRMAVQILHTVQNAENVSTSEAQAVMAAARGLGSYRDASWREMVFPQAFALYEAAEKMANASPEIPAPPAPRSEPAAPTSAPRHLTGQGLFSLFQTLSKKVHSGEAPTAQELEDWHANEAAFKGRMLWLEKQLNNAEAHPDQAAKWQNEYNAIQAVINQLG